MNRQRLTPTVTAASVSRAAVFTHRADWHADFSGAIDSTVMGETKPYHQRPKEASPPT